MIFWLTLRDCLRVEHFTSNIQEDELCFLISKQIQKTTTSTNRWQEKPIEGDGQNLSLLVMVTEECWPHHLLLHFTLLLKTPTLNLVFENQDLSLLVRLALFKKVLFLQVEITYQHL